MEQLLISLGAFFVPSEFGRRKNLEKTTICEVLILGSGFGGTMAANLLRQRGKDVVVVDKKSEPSRNHFALMRFKDKEVAKPLGATLRKVVVEKAVWWEGKLHYTADIQMKNQYSLKTYGVLGHRSLSSLGMKERYLVEADQLYTAFDRTLWGYSPREIKREAGKTVAVLERGDEVMEVVCDACISTIPLPITIKLAGLPLLKDLFVARKISVNKGRLKYGLNNGQVSQTIYYPESTTIYPIYRATIESDWLIAESMGVAIKESCPSDMKQIFNICRTSFGLRDDSLEEDSFRAYTQALGKIFCRNEVERRKYIYRLTDLFKVYSLGRFGTWRPIRTDDIINDCAKVINLIYEDEKEVLYKRRKEDWQDI